MSTPARIAPTRAYRAAAVAGVLLLTGCTAAQTPEPVETADAAWPTVAPSVSPTPWTAPEREPLLAHRPVDETVLVALDNQEGVETIFGLPIEAPVLAVYAECTRGQSTDIRISIGGIDLLPMGCTINGQGHRQEVDVSFLDLDERLPVTVKVKAGTTWALTIAETKGGASS